MGLMTQRDKALHFAIGVVVAIMTVALGLLGSTFGAWVAVLGAGVAIGVGYELVQWWRGSGDPSLLDALATIGGSAVGALLVWIVTG